MRNDPVPRYRNESDWRAPVPREEIIPEIDDQYPRYPSVPWISIPDAVSQIDHKQSIVLEHNSVSTSVPSGTTPVPNWIIATLALSSGVAAGWFLRKLFYNDYRSGHGEDSVEQRPFFENDLDNDYRGRPTEARLPRQASVREEAAAGRQAYVGEGAAANRQASMGNATAVDDIKKRLEELERKAAISQWTSDLNISPFSPHRGGPPQYPFRHDFPREGRHLLEQNQTLALPPGPDSNFRK